MDATVSHVEDYDPVENVCEQTLRELPQTDDVSIAHVRVDAQSSSLWHHHDQLTEFYYLLDGTARLLTPKTTLQGGPGLHRTIEPGTPHQLQNTTDEPVEHLVVSVPPFDPQDVQVHDEPPAAVRSVRPFEDETEPVEAADGALVRELFSNDRCSIAHGTLEPNQSARAHAHEGFHEMYYITEGEGTVRLSDRTEPIKSGSVVIVPPGTVHGLNNETDRPLTALCLCGPPYNPDDVQWYD